MFDDLLPFDPDANASAAGTPVHGFGHCNCRARGRRLFTGGLLAAAVLPAWAREGVDVGKKSWAVDLIPAAQVEQGAAQQYQQMMGQEAGKRALLPPDHPQTRRLRSIAARMIPFALPWNDRAQQWKWEVNLVVSPQLNAFCMPGGKIAFYYGILEKLKLSDDEVATIMGHEIAHALREHARERMAKTTGTRVGANLLSNLLGLGNLGDAAMQVGANLLTLTYSRSDESEADLVGMELAARSGYDPAAGVSLWEKMTQAAKGAPPQFLSTHPSSKTRIKEIQLSLPKVQGLYERSAKPPQRFEVAGPLR
ncbi:M48 family metalloprotease [Paucibacter sp. JuS9]|uniref:M48 family metalloprotease n=1 Tax=Roseateles TaxID=93681 RepID=UPI002FE57A0F